MLFRSDLDVLAPLSAQFGPLVTEVAGGLDEVPEGATSMAFRRTVVSNV